MIIFSKNLLENSFVMFHIVVAVAALTWDPVGVGVEPHSPGARSRHQHPGHGLRHLQQARGGQEEEEKPGQPSHWHWRQHRAFL